MATEQDDHVATTLDLKTNDIPVIAMSLGDIPSPNHVFMARAAHLSCFWAGFVCQREGVHGGSGVHAL